MLPVELSPLQQAVQNYQDEGYRVLASPSGEDLPSFLQGYIIDLLAQNDQESVAVLVRSHRELPQLQLPKLSNAIQQQPGWSLDVIVIPPAPVQRATWSQDQIQMALTRAEALLQTNSPDVALLLVWSALEAVLRLWVTTENLNLELETTTLQALLKTLLVRSLLSEADYRVLRQGLETRNVIAHGLQLALEEQTEVLNLVFVQRLITITRQLLADILVDTP